MSDIRKFMKYFKWEHLPHDLQMMSKPFEKIAAQVVFDVENGELDEEEARAGLRKLLEAKDCVVRSALK